MVESQKVHVVHCIDTEGPLLETLNVTFQRLKEIFGVSLDPSVNTLKQLQAGSIDLGGLEVEIAQAFSPHLLNYNDTWDKIDAMLYDILSSSFRSRYLDSFGGGWIYNWHCLDFVGFSENPRRRDIGFHNVFDHYRQILNETGSDKDGLYFHHHPVPFSKAAHHTATHYFSHNPIVFEILARKIIDRGWFPSVNRPGFHVTRPDSHWLMEQFIPFDYANQSGAEDYSCQLDLKEGRFGDWRRAPMHWSPYHPDHDDYQSIGNCRRWIARCLNVGTRLRLLQQHHVDDAFMQAAHGKPVVLAFANHDFRDIRSDIDHVAQMLMCASKRFPGTQFEYCDAREAMRKALKIPNFGPIKLTLSMVGQKLVVSTNTDSFGPQPFLALKTKEGNYFHDNLDFQVPRREWSYVFDENTLPLDAVEVIGVATCDQFGNVCVSRFYPSSNFSENLYL